MTEEQYSAKHGQTAHDMLKGLAAIGQQMEEGWNIDPADWDVAYNIGMHVPCTRDESGPYVIHYAWEFNVDGLANELDQAGFCAMRKRLLYEVVATEANTGELPGFMVFDG